MCVDLHFGDFARLNVSLYLFLLLIIQIDYKYIDIVCTYPWFCGQ